LDLAGDSVENVGRSAMLLRWNAAERRYCIWFSGRGPCSIISNDVQVWSRAHNNDSIYCILLSHLLEHPRLCDQSAVEMVRNGAALGERSNGSSRNPTSTVVLVKERNAGASSQYTQRQGVLQETRLVSMQQAHNVYWNRKKL
jgi:hypothetical protein